MFINDFINSTHGLITIWNCQCTFPIILLLRCTTWLCAYNFGRRMFIKMIIIVGVNVSIKNNVSILISLRQDSIHPELLSFPFRFIKQKYPAPERSSGSFSYEKSASLMIQLWCGGLIWGIKQQINPWGSALNSKASLKTVHAPAQPN